MTEEEITRKASELWDIHNTKREELDEVARIAESNRENGLEAMGRYVRENWNKQDLIDYYMGNIENRRSGSFYWANKVGKSKITLIKHYLENGIPTNLEEAVEDLKRVEAVLETSCCKWFYIEDEFHYWNNMELEELMRI